MWNAISLVQDLNSCRRVLSYDDNHYTTGTSNSFTSCFYVMTTHTYGCIFSVWVNRLGHLGLILGRVTRKTQNMVLDASLLNIQHYKLQIKGKYSNPGKGVVLSLTPCCSSYRKKSLRVTLDYSRLTYLETRFSRRHLIKGDRYRFVLSFFFVDNLFGDLWTQLLKFYVFSTIPRRSWGTSGQSSVCI